MPVKKKYIFIYSNGFSLIELLVVLSIIATLVTLAYPSYQQYLIQSRRTDGQSALLDLATRMERYYAENNTYDAAPLSTPTSPGTWYQLSITAQDDVSFSLQATPQGAQSADTICQSLTFNHTGEKGITSGPGGEPTGNGLACW